MLHRFAFFPAARSGGPRWLLLVAALAVPLGFGLLGPAPAFAQVGQTFGIESDPEPEGIELLQSEPFDLIRFTAEAGGGWAKVALLDLPGRRVPADPSGRLRVRVLGVPGEEFDVAWGSIASIDLWEERLASEANARMVQGDFAGAYPFLAALLRDFPDNSGMNQLRSEYLLRNAAAALGDGSLRSTLAILEELRRFNPQFRSQAVLRAISQVTDRLMTELVRQGRLEDAQKLLGRLEEQYAGEAVESITIWNERFLGLAQRKRQEALDAREAGRMRQARQLARDSLHLYPRIEGGQQLVRDIDQQYPLVNVGVMQSATELDPTRIDNWPARRSGRLVYRALFEMRGAGPEGGEYEFLFGDSELSDDRQQLYLDLRPDRFPPSLDSVDAYVLADYLAAMATLEHPLYSVPWAAITRQIAVPGPRQLEITLRRPHVLPRAMLQARVDAQWGAGPADGPTGPYHLDDSDPEESTTRFVLNDLEGVADNPALAGLPREIVEIQQDDPGEAIAALLRGDLDLIDRVVPADAARLRRSRQVRVENYLLPSVHLLVPCSDHPFVANRTFRRALVYGINREDILHGELLGNQRVEGCRVISGPFPAGVRRDDPLAYAYDESIAPLPYQPQVARLLITMTENRFRGEAEKREESPPEITPIRIGYPADATAARACEAIRSQLGDALGLPIELIELPPGRTQPDPGTCDLVYMAVALWEPIIDARRVLGPDGLAASNDQLVGLGLRRLEEARSWREVRERLLELHSTAHHELPVLPLWQMVDSYAYRPGVQGIGTEILSLYQNIDRWRLAQ